MTIFFVATSVLPSALRLPSPIALVLSAALFGWGVWRISTWSARPGWTERHWLAVVTGVVLYFDLIWAPLIEFGARLPRPHRTDGVRPRGCRRAARMGPPPAAQREALRRRLDE
jgi:hypothetical protein